MFTKYVKNVAVIALVLAVMAGLMGNGPVVQNCAGYDDNGTGIAFHHNGSLLDICNNSGTSQHVKIAHDPTVGDTWYEPEFDLAPFEVHTGIVLYDDCGQVDIWFGTTERGWGNAGSCHTPTPVPDHEFSFHVSTWCESADGTSQAFYKVIVDKKVGVTSFSFDHNESGIMPDTSGFTITATVTYVDETVTHQVSAQAPATDCSEETQTPTPTPPVTGTPTPTLPPPPESKNCPGIPVAWPVGSEIEGQFMNPATNQPYDSILHVLNVVASDGTFAMPSFALDGTWKLFINGNFSGYFVTKGTATTTGLSTEGSCNYFQLPEIHLTPLNPTPVVDCNHVMAGAVSCDQKITWTVLAYCLNNPDPGLTLTGVTLDQVKAGTVRVNGTAVATVTFWDNPVFPGKVSGRWEYANIKLEDTVSLHITLKGLTLDLPVTIRDGQACGNPGIAANIGPNDELIVYPGQTPIDIARITEFEGDDADLKQMWHDAHLATQQGISYAIPGRIRINMGLFGIAP